MIPDTVRKGITVQFITEYRHRRIIFLTVYILNRSPSKAKDNGMNEGVFYIPEHFTKSRPMRLINNDNDPLGHDLLQITCPDLLVILRYITELLDRCDNQSVFRSIAGQFGGQHLCIGCILYHLARAGKCTVVIERLSSQCLSVNQKDNFICIMPARDQLSRFKTGQGLARTCCMPHMPAKYLPIIPVLLRNLGCYLCCRIVLITTHYLQRIVLAVCNGIETYQGMRHRNIQKS